MGETDDLNLSGLFTGSSTLTTILVISVCFVDSVSIAYDGSVIGSLNAMPTYLNYFTLNTTTISLNTAAVFMGAVLMCLTAPYIINTWGRKRGILISALIQIVGTILQGAAQNIAMFIVGRIVVGAGCGLAQPSANTYVAETIPARIRAFSLGLYFSCWCVGSLVAAGICYGTQNIDSTWAWRIPSLIQAVPSILCIVVLFFIPESPRYLVYNDRHEEALHALGHINGHSIDSPVVQLQYREITETLAFEKGEGRSLGFLETVKTASNRRRILLAFSVAPLTMLTGSNIITYYFSTMMYQAGITSADTELQINVILQSWQLVVALLGSLLAERIGRRKLALSSLISCTFFFYLLGGLTSKYGTSTNKSGIYGTIACIFLFNGAYGFGATPLTAMYPPEVLSYSIRPAGLAVFTISAKLCGLFVTFAFPYALAAIGWKTYMINASFNVLLVVWIYFFWVETKGLTLEEVDAIFDGEKHSQTPNLKDISDDKMEVFVGVEEKTIGDRPPSKA